MDQRLLPITLSRFVFYPLCFTTASTDISSQEARTVTPIRGKSKSSDDEAKESIKVFQSGIGQAEDMCTEPPVLHCLHCLFAEKIVRLHVSM